MRALSKILIAIVILAMTQSAWATQDCHGIRLRHTEAQRTVSAAQKVARFTIDSKSLSACRIGKTRFANLQTLRQGQPDGSEIWDAAGCRDQTDGRWNCAANPQRGVQFETQPGASKSWVNIPLDMEAATAARIVSTAYSQAATLNVTQACRKVPGNASYTFTMFQRLFRDEAAGELMLMPEKLLVGEGEGLALTRADFYVAIVRSSKGSQDWQVRCWEELEYL
ncbi:MAG TPA: hypothetical protein VGQ27_12160 [Steroidobacteraceae bacterium]|nr:hypothetical protein [Steroidobacteraceae bacterium]